MAVLESTEYIAVQRQWQEEDREFKAKIAKLEADNKLRLAEIRIVEQGRARAKLVRYEVIQRCVLAVVKIVPVTIAMIAASVLLFAKHDVPDFLQRFLEV